MSTVLHIAPQPYNNSVSGAPTLVAAPTARGRATLGLGLTLSASLALSAALLLVNRATMARLFGTWSYYLMLALVIAWAFSVWRVTRGLDLRALVRDNAVGIAASAVIVLSLFVSIRPELRVLSDEANLVGVSQSMATEHTAYHHYIGKWYYGIYHSQIDGIEKRPLLFSFLVSIVHSATGYRVANAFALNAAAAFALLLVVYFVVRARFERTTAIACALLVAAQPIVAICATSAGFDLVAVLFIGLAFVALHRYVNQPSADTLLSLWATALMLAHTRYESLLFVGLIALYLVASKRLRWRDLAPNAILYGLTPLLLLPRLWAHVLKSGDYENPPGTALFAVSHLVRNLGELVRHQLDVTSNLPYVLPLFWLAALGAVHVLARHVVRRRSLRANGVYVTAAVALVLYYALLLSHFMGKFTHPSQARFFLVLAFVAALASPLYLRSVLRLPPRLLLLAALTIFVVARPSAAAGAFMNAQVLPRRVKAVLAELERRGNHQILLVAEYPAAFAVYDYSTTTFERARRDLPRLRSDLRRHLFSDVLVIQRVRYRDDQPEPESMLPPGVIVESLFAFQDDSDHYTRVAKIVDFDSIPPLNEEK